MFGIVKTLVGYFAASVGLRIDVEHSVIRFLLTFFFYFFHQFLYWVLARGLLGRQIAFEVQRTLVLGLLNAVVGVTLFHFWTGCGNPPDTRRRLRGDHRHRGLRLRHRLWIPHGYHHVIPRRERAGRLLAEVSHKLNFSIVP